MIKTETKYGGTKKWKSDVKWIHSGDFLSSGANILLSRHLVLDKFEGCVQTWSYDFEGDFCLSQHWFNKIEETKVLNKSVEVQRVDRLMVSKDGKQLKTSSFFLSATGHLLKEICPEFTSTIHLNTFSDLPPKTCVKDRHLNWESDIQLMSTYLDYKWKREEELKTKLEQPRFKNVLRDYILCLVKNKPQSVMNFTLDFVRKLERNGNARSAHQIYQTADRRRQRN